MNRVQRGIVAAVGSVALLAVAFVAPATAALYDLTGSYITVTNAQLPAPVVEPVTGTMSLVDDGFGNITLSGDFGFNFVVSINIGGGLVVGDITTDTVADYSGTGTRTGSVVQFDNPVDYFPEGSILCEDGGGLLNLCSNAGFPDGVPVIIPDDTPGETFLRTFGDLTFGPGDLTFTMADFVLSPPGDDTVQTLSITGTLIPEPTTAILLGGGLVGLALAGRRS